MATYARGDKEWVKMPGCVEIPLELVGELHNRRLRRQRDLANRPVGPL